MRRKVAAGLAVGMMLVAMLAACGDEEDETRAAASSGRLRAEPTAGRWRSAP